MAKTPRDAAEERFAKLHDNTSTLQKEKEAAERQRSEKVDRLRALRLAKEASEREAQERAAAEKAAVAPQRKRSAST